jgi:hypothetical protein
MKGCDIAATLLVWVVLICCVLNSQSLWSSMQKMGMPTMLDRTLVKFVTGVPKLTTRMVASSNSVLRNID